jgi:hypothetical protein
MGVEIGGRPGRHRFGFGHAPADQLCHADARRRQHVTDAVTCVLPATALPRLEAI